MNTFQISRRFCGPRNSGNGGYSAGMVAKHLVGPVEVNLLAPPPLECDITIAEESDGLVALSGETKVIAAKPTLFEGAPPPCPDEAQIQRGRDAFLTECDGVHNFPYCFVCGDKREPEDGLRIFSGKPADSIFCTDFWVPAGNLADANGLVHPEFIWAALDCPTAFASQIFPNYALLAKFAVEVKAAVRTGERYAVVAWNTGDDGRKKRGEAVLYDGDGEWVARSRALWIVATDERMIKKFKQEREN